MTDQSRARRPSRPRSIARRAGGILVVLLLVGGITYLIFGENLKSSVHTFEFAEATHYRVRITGGTLGVECVKLERYTARTRSRNWKEMGRDCAWPRVADGDGWLAGGQVERVRLQRSGSLTRDRLFYGMVPSAAAEVVITLTDGVPHRFATTKVGEGANRIYAGQVADVDDNARIVDLRLHDAQGGELRVY